MQELLEPLKAESLVDVFVRRFEELILSGKISMGQKLPSERELALQLGVSRPVVHEGLLDLEAKGLVTLIPRVGTVVNDYRREGSLTLLNSLVNYHQGRLEKGILESLLRMRALFELETARLAAQNRSEEQLEEFKALLGEEQKVNRMEIERITDLDFRFHLLVAVASGNVIYPLLMNSFRQVYTNLTYQFFSDPSVVDFVFASHASLTKAIEKRDAATTAQIMTAIMTHGENMLKFQLKSETSEED